MREHADGDDGQAGVRVLDEDEGAQQERSAHEQPWSKVRRSDEQQEEEEAR